MTRTITGTPQGRRGRVRLRAATLLAAPVAALAVLAGCSAGQISQTDTMKAAVTGVSADSADGSISLRDVAIEYGGSDGYPAGAAIPLRVFIVNNSVTESANLLGVDLNAPGGGRVALLGGEPVTGPASSAPSTPTPSATGGSASASPSVRPSGSASASASPSPTASPPPPAARLEIGPDQLAALVRTKEDPAYLAVVGRTEKLDYGATLTLVFHFDRNRDITVTVPSGIPLSPLPRGSAVVGVEH